MRFVAVIAASVAMLAGCQQQRTVVVEQAAAGSVSATPPMHVLPPLPHPRAASPCSAPAGTGPFERLPKPLTSFPVVTPARAKIEHITGCAGVRFRIGPDGHAQDITLMAEYPLGYGFGDAALHWLSTATWPPHDDLAGHYAVLTIRSDLAGSYTNSH
ncbi:MAG TPA: energy transducer TonB [Acetobacteraceae bacterium]|nr:energy transducer TonB [Acetobacteraceae bacterium]